MGRETRDSNRKTSREEREKASPPRRGGHRMEKERVVTDRDSPRHREKREREAAERRKGSAVEMT